LLFLLSSIIFHFESSIFTIGVTCFFSHKFANTLYAEASSRGVISHAQSARGAQYHLELSSDLTHSLFINGTISFCPHAK
jgi:hypothetical protein